jgi:ankyrin repeat protein
MLEPILVIHDMNTASLETIKNRYKDLHVTDASGKNLLFYAVQTGRKDVFEDLLKRGIRISARDDQGESVLFEVIRRQHINMLARLLHEQIDVIQMNDQGQTPLHIAAQSGNIDMIHMLRDSRATHQKDLFGRLPIHEAVLNGKLKALIWLVKTDQQSLFVTTDEGYNLLHFSMLTFNQDLIQFLIEHDVDINGLSNELDTPLHLAVRHQNELGVRLLLEAHAFMDIPNKYKETPMDEAKDIKEIHQLFEEYAFDVQYMETIHQYQKIHAVLKRDKKRFSELEQSLMHDPYDRYQKKARDYITYYHFEKLFKGQY